MDCHVQRLISILFACFVLCIQTEISNCLFTSISIPLSAPEGQNTASGGDTETMFPVQSLSSLFVAESALEKLVVLMKDLGFSGIQVCRQALGFVSWAINTNVTPLPQCSFNNPNALGNVYRNRGTPPLGRGLNSHGPPCPTSEQRCPRCPHPATRTTQRGIPCPRRWRSWPS